MNVRLNIFLVLVLFLSICLPDVSSSQPKNSVGVVVIDPGHGGREPGTVFGKYYEKDINLSVALMLGGMIKEKLPGVKVVYTRETDIFLTLDKRGEIANKANADLFISIHVNSLERASPSGAMTFVMGVDKTGANLDIAMRENDVIRYEEDYSTTYEGYVPGSTESFVIFSLMQYVYMDQSLAFADILQKQYTKNTPMPDKGVRQAGFVVLWRPAMPSVLTELGFLPNEHDRAVLISAKGQKTMATAIFNAICEYKSNIEGKSLPTSIESGGTDTQVAGTTVEDKTGNYAGTDARNVRNITNSGSTPAGNVIYRIQIMSSSRKISGSSNDFKAYKGKVFEIRDGSRYKYSVGEFGSYGEALKMQSEVRKVFPDAFTVAFDGGRQITVSKAREITERP